jgi:glycosyltransferase involved in cell wall biosynthesis
MNESKFGIVIPCFNEAGSLPILIGECDYLSQQGSFEFVLVNNGSSDISAEILEEICNPKIRVVNLINNAGYGGGILAGLKELKTEYVGWIHADLQTDLKDSLIGLENLEFDFFKGIRLGRTKAERLFSAGMSIICSILFRTSLVEINAQPTIMKKKLYDSWINPPLDFSLDLYSLLIAKKRKVTILRSEFYFSKRTSGQSTWNFGFKSRVKMISRTMRYAILLFRVGVK